MRSLCAVLAGLLASGVIGAEAEGEPALTLIWDQQAVRAAASDHIPTALWSADPASARLRTTAAAIAAADPSVPDLALAWDAWRTLRMAGSATGASTWELSGITADHAWLAKRFAVPVDITGDTARVDDPRAPALPTAAQAPIHGRLDVGSLAAGSATLAPLLDQILVGWRLGSGRLEVQLQPEAGAWTGQAILTGMTTTLQPVDPRIAGRLGPAGLRAAVHVTPALIATAVARLAGPHLAFVEDLLGRPPAEAAELLTGDVAVSIAPGLPRPHVVLVIGTRPDAELGPLLGNLGDAFSARPTAIAGAAQAWSWDSAAGPVHAGSAPGVIVIATDPGEVALALAGVSDGWTIPAGSALHLEADPALVSVLLPLVWSVAGPLPVGADPLVGLLRSLAPGAEGLAALGATGWDALYAAPEGLSWGPAEALRSARPPADGEAQVAALIGGAGSTSDRLRSRVAVWTAAGQPPLLVARRSDGYYAVHGAKSGGPLSEGRLHVVTKGMQRIIGPDLAQLEVVACPPRPLLEARLLPAPPAYAQAAGLWTATLIQDANRAELRERGAPVLSLLTLYGALRWWQAAQVQTSEL
jgi:hypothetical protein